VRLIQHNPGRQLTAGVEDLDADDAAVRVLPVIF